MGRIIGQGRQPASRLAAGATRAAALALAFATADTARAGARSLFLSSIFKWFRGDFEAAAGSLPAFVARYAGHATAEALRRGGVKIEFLDYDWSLNGR